MGAKGLKTAALVNVGWSSMAVNQAALSIVLYLVMSTWTADTSTQPKDSRFVQVHHRL
jgi:hypothetical protein